MATLTKERDLLARQLEDVASNFENQLRELEQTSKYIITEVCIWLFFFFFFAHCGLNTRCCSCDCAGGEVGKTEGREGGPERGAGISAAGDAFPGGREE